MLARAGSPGTTKVGLRLGLDVAPEVRTLRELQTPGVSDG
jgi:hypothetical protein